MGNSVPLCISLSEAPEMRESQIRRQTRPSTTDPVEDNIEELVHLSQRGRLAMSFSDRLADRLTAFSGSMVFVALHALWFGVWIITNLGLFGLPKFDPFPFGLLTMIVSLEAIFLSTFVLISQNRQALQADRRQKVNMEVDVLAEQEITQLIKMMADIHHHLGLHGDDDEEVHSLERPTHLEDLADRIDEAEARLTTRNGSSPRGAADTKG